ncbi:MAG: hypothetical protein ACFB4I_17900 [Cyanophyceae cyanobacterium]
MNTLLPMTLRRLNKLPQTLSVWEGDRRHLSGNQPDPEEESTGECIIWVDGSEGHVRAMDVVPTDVGLEAVVRTLLRAIENPNNPAQPARPQKIIVRDREIQFFLRGALHDLEIAVEYVPQLPLIDELFQHFEQANQSAPPTISPQQEQLLVQAAQELWHKAPWDVLTDDNILAIAINQWEIDTLYACVMGMLGREYGVILYRSLDSVRQFREAVLVEESVESLERAFLAQNCWFLNFELDEDSENAELSPLFGSIHPYEGMNPLRDEEEAKVVYTALQGLVRFLESSKEQLALDPMEPLSQTYQISAPEAIAPTPISVTVSTLPDFVTELRTMEAADLVAEENEELLNIPIQDDLVPKDAIYSIGMLPWEVVEQLSHRSKTYFKKLPAASGDRTPAGEGLPMVLIQTSRPKAKVLIETLKAAGGLEAICFNPGEDWLNEMEYDIGILKTGNGELHLFGEFDSNSPQHIQARQKWNRRCQQTRNYCGLVIAMGVTGVSRGNPQLKDMLALFEAKAIEAQDLGMGILQLDYGLE